MADPNVAIARLLASARRVYDSGSGSTVRMMRDADALLRRGLSAILLKTGPQTRFTEASAQMYRAQIRVVQEYTNRRLLGLTHEQAMRAAKSSIGSAVRLMKELEESFTGISLALRLDEVAAQDALLRGIDASLLQQHTSSVNRYGSMMVGKFEQNLQLGLLTGMSQHQVATRLVESAASRGITAATLHGHEPDWFPAPTSYLKERYWAERIVRTETAYAANYTNLRTIQESAADAPGLHKKILATFDRRTAADSVAVHGQIRAPDAYFRDGAGREYLHPPARPNDRETVIPWRVSWPETDLTRMRPPAEVAEAEMACVPAAERPQGEARRQQMRALRQQARERQRQARERYLAARRAESA